MEATTLINLAQLAIAQEQLEHAGQLLAEANTIAAAQSYWDSLAWAAQAAGDLEFLQPEPSMAQLVNQYLAACAYAAHFNDHTLEQQFQAVRERWQAHAEDGYGDQACAFCAIALAAWAQVDDDVAKTKVQHFLEQLQAELGCHNQ